MMNLCNCGVDGEENRGSNFSNNGVVPDKRGGLKGAGRK